MEKFGRMQHLLRVLSVFLIVMRSWFEHWQVFLVGLRGSNLLSWAVKQPIASNLSLIIF